MMKGLYGCVNTIYKNQIDWDEREKELVKLLNKHRRKDGYWDVIVPSSGGKDSAIVAHKLKHDYGMNPLTVTWAPLKYTDIGWENLQAHNDSGFTNLLCTPNGQFKENLQDFLLRSWVMHFMYLFLVSTATLFSWE